MYKNNPCSVARCHNNCQQSRPVTGALRATSQNAVGRPAAPRNAGPLWAQYEFLCSTTKHPHRHMIKARSSKKGILSANRKKRGRIR